MLNYPSHMDHYCPLQLERAKQGPTGNWLLDALPPADYERLEPHLIRMPLARGRILYEGGEPVHNVYFPAQGLTSLVLTDQSGTEVEVCTVGPEGVVSVAALLGYDKTFTRSVVQIAGSASWMPATVLQQESQRCGALQNLMRCYLRFLVAQSFQTTLCNRLHKVEARLSRWLLTTSERTQMKKLPLTQEFISHMLGTRRAGVSEACIALAKAGVIEHKRGHFTIVDYDALEARACECYVIIRDEMQRVYSNL